MLNVFLFFKKLMRKLQFDWKVTGETNAAHAVCPSGPCSKGMTAPFCYYLSVKEGGVGRLELVHCEKFAVSDASIVIKQCLSVK